MSIKSYRFDGGKNLRLQEQPTGAGEQKQQKAELKAKTAENLRKAALLAEKLCAAGTEGLVIAIQARDAAGKDSLIKHVFSALNPQAMEVHAFKTPTSQELSHDYLWRIGPGAAAPGEGGHPEPFPLRGCAGGEGASPGKDLPHGAPVPGG